ncbi:MAG TPA: sigma-70 family RNA polymerase sigma factor [Thermoanaerobaculia bacterium]|nr:sigma-70 family RNA polymerase sigma factor [Thermoanaerobaculia bacterium]
MATLPPDQLFLTHLAHIERVATYFCRRSGFSREETEDCVSSVKQKLIEDDYAIILKFQGKSIFKTYLTVVIRRLFLDYLDHLWGRRWRPSAEAERLGPLAIQLEGLLHRDGLSFDEACQILRTNHHVEASPQELADLAARLPHRTPPRRMESEETLENRPTKEPAPDEQIVAKEGGRLREKVLGLLKEALAQLPAEDALIAKMSCEFKVSEIALRLGLEQKPLYRRLEKILKALREYLESHGVRPDEIGGLLSIPEDDHEPRE